MTATTKPESVQTKTDRISEVSTRVAKWNVNGHTFNRLGERGTKDQTTAYGYRRIHGGEITLTWIVKW